MIDAHRAARDIISTVHGPNELNSAAVRATTAALAECWDDCVAKLPPKLRDADAPNPYRLALDLAPDGPHAPAVEFVDEPVKSQPERDTRQRHLFITTVDDDELIAMQIIVQALDGLDQRAQNRVITYISERMA